MATGEYGREAERIWQKHKRRRLTVITSCTERQAGYPGLECCEPICVLIKGWQEKIEDA